MPFCSQCGTKNEEGARFCLNCGASLVLSPPVPSVRRKSTLLPFGGIIFAAIIIIVAFVLLASFSKVSVVPKELSSKFRGRESPIGIVTGLPREIERIVFKEWGDEFPKINEYSTRTFNQPIMVTLRGGDDPEIYEEYQTGKIDYLPLPWHEGWIIHDGLRNFLVNNHYAEVRTATAHGPLGADVESVFLFYNESIKPYILNGSCEPGSYFTLLLARRKLRRIDFKNEYEQLGEKFYTIKFTYTLEEELRGLPDIEKEFQGKAELYWDPSEGAWTLQYINLDLGFLEYEDVMSEIYGE